MRSGISFVRFSTILSMLAGLERSIRTSSLRTEASNGSPCSCSQTRRSFPSCSSFVVNFPCICFRNRSSFNNVVAPDFLVRSRCLLHLVSSKSDKFAFKILTSESRDRILLFVSCLDFKRSTSLWILSSFDSLCSKCSNFCRATSVADITHSSPPWEANSATCRNGLFSSDRFSLVEPSTCPQNSRRSAGVTPSASHTTVNASISLWVMASTPVTSASISEIHAFTSSSDRAGRRKRALWKLA